MANSEAKVSNNDESMCVVRSVNITVEVKASQRFIISKTVEESIDDMFERLRDECNRMSGKKDCDVCRRIIKLAEKHNGEVSNVLSNYDRNNNMFILHICIDFDEHTDSVRFCNELENKKNEGAKAE